MSSQVTLSDAFVKLNEIGQMLILINNMTNLSDSEKSALKELATQKNPEMLKSLHQYKLDQNFEALSAVWKTLIPESDQKSSFLRKKTLEYRLPVTLHKPGRIEPVTNTLTSLRKSIGLDKKNPKDLAIQLKNSFQSKESLSFEDFSTLVLKIDSTSERLANLNKLKAVKMLFENLDDNKSGSLSKGEVLNNMVMLAGGSPDEKIAALFIVNDTEGDGLIGYEAVVEHLKQSIALSFIFDPLLKKPNVTVEALALATAENLFSVVDCSVMKVVSQAEYLAWTRREKVSDEEKMEKELRIKARIEKREKIVQELKEMNAQFCSKENLKDIFLLKVKTGLGRVPISNALQVFRAKNSSGYYSRQQFTDIIQELVLKYNSNFALNSEFYSAVCKLFTRFDQDRNGVMDTSELFCGLCLICAGTLGDKIHAAFNSFDESRDGMMQFAELQKFFKVIIKMNFPEEGDVGINPHELARETAQNLFLHCSLTPSDSVTPDMLKKWFLVSKLKIH